MLVVRCRCEGVRGMKGGGADRKGGCGMLGNEEHRWRRILLGALGCGG